LLFCYELFLNNFLMEIKKIPFNETENWNAFRKGNRNAFSLIYEKYFNGLYNYGGKFSRESAFIEDCIQDLFVKLWQNRENISETPSVKNYLYKSLRNTIYSRQNKVENVDIDDDLINELDFNLEISQETYMIENEHSQQMKFKLDKALDNLTNRQREAVFLRFFEELTYEEVANLMRITVKALYKIIARALENLREAFRSLIIFLLLIH
jgi:RNA polymerase sigma factor (sigma-70 family)